MASTRKPEDTLSPREFEAVTMLAIDGARTADIARELSVACDTAKRYLSVAMEKTARETRTALALWYVRRYPTAQAREDGYVAACIYLAERMHGRTRYRVRLASSPRRAT